MSRAERRRGEKAARKRQRWQRNILKFSHIAAGVLESYVVAVDAYPLLLADAAVGDPTATALARSMSMWAQEAAKPDSRFLCLCCDDQEFGPGIGAPVAFAISLPFANRDAALVTGVCERCAESEDLKEMTLRRLRGIWPDIYSTQGGQA